MNRTPLLPAAAFALFGLAAALPGQAGGQEFRGQLKIGWHDVKLEAGTLYEIVLGNLNALDLTVDMVEAPLHIVVGDDPRDDRFFYLPNATDKYHLFVIPGVGVPKQATFNYTLKVKPLALGKKPLLETKGKWTAKDSTYKREWQRFFKAYKVELKVGQLYVIDLIGDGAAADPFLFLEDDQGTVVARDDDGGGNLNARIIYTPKETGEFRIIATTLERATGDFTLRVRRTE